MGLKITQVDAFADKPFAGNPAAVCILEQPRDEAWMQLLAREMNLSETAFLVKREGAYDLRWFTPLIEVDLCGHATLASAHVLWEQGHLNPGETASFRTKSGVLTATKKGNWTELNFPATPVKLDSGLREDIDAALGAKVRHAGRTCYDYFAELESEEAVRSVSPNFSRLARLPARGLVVTSRASGAVAPTPSGLEYDYVSRFFAPAAGIDEDPVTGSAHCGLGPYWKECLGHDNLVGYQASARGGIVCTRCEDGRVILSGQAVTVWRGELA